MKKSKEEILQNKIDYLREKRINDKKKYNELKSAIIQMRRKILLEMKDLEEKIKDIMYLK